MNRSRLKDKMIDMHDFVSGIIARGHVAFEDSPPVDISCCERELAILRKSIADVVIAIDRAEHNDDW